MPPARCAESPPRTQGWPAAVAAALLLSLAAPGIAPGGSPGWGLLVLPGLACLFRLLDARRAWLWCYVVGAVHIGVFSWSVRHVLFVAWLSIVLLGGCYFAVLPVWVAALRRVRVPAALAFGAAIAGSAWLRTYCPEITYPHAQPAHALYRWPGLLAGPTTVGGEVLVNVLLAAAAAGVLDACRRVRRRAGMAAMGWVASLWILLAFVRRPDEPARAIDVAAVQPGAFAATTRATLAAWQRERLVQPTLAAAGRRVESPADLVLWPESTSFVDIVPGPRQAPGTRPANDDGARLVAALDWLADVPLPLADHTKLLLGGRVAAGASEGIACAVLVDGRGALLGHHLKVRLVPGGERQPFLGWLPAAWSQALQRSMASALGAAPHLVAGAVRPPLAVSDGITVGSLICYDNAFPDVARAYVQAGANLLAVLSNEMWYRGGAELDQMEAMTVLRALETRVPIVRSTVDGETLAVDAQGRVIGRLPRGAAGVLRVRVPVPLRGGPVAPAAPAVALLCALSLAFAIAHGLVTWVRLRRSFRGPRPMDSATNMPAVGA